jgi:hypothetical protein
MGDETLRWLAPLGFGVFFVTLWVATFRVIARVGGWRELAEAYPPRGITASGLGERFRMRSLQLRRGVNYNNCVTLTAGPAALQLSLPRLFGFGHPPIEVPWSDVTAEAGRAFWMPIVTLRCARLPSVPVRLRRKLAEQVARASGGQLRLPEAR